MIAASGAFEDWSQTPLEGRIEFLQRLPDGLVNQLDELGATVAQEVGTPTRAAPLIQGGVSAVIIQSFIDLARTFPWEEPVGRSIIVREPVGVVAAITPWNYSLFQAMSKVALALTAECTSSDQRRKSSRSS